MAIPMVGNEIYKQAADRLLKAAAKIYVGKNSRLTKEELEQFVSELEASTGADLRKMRLLSNKSQFFRNLARSYIPNSARQIPSRLFRLAQLGVAPLAPTVAIGQLLEMPVQVQ